MKSLDTNILLYATNADCEEHAACRGLVTEALKEGDVWVIADQVWFELYSLLRDPAVLQRPLDAGRAADTIAWYREKSGWLRCAWEPAMMGDLEPLWRSASFSPRRVFDLVLAVTLKAHGVDRFYTRNVRDFEGLGFFELIDPV
jgi:toxin-antitoxin system PIN domain toxin